MECCRCYFLLVWFVLLGRLVAVADHANFTFNGFRGANLSLAGSAAITADGILRLTDAVKLQVGHAFYPFPLRFRGPSNGTAANATGATFSFASTFVFAVLSPVAEISGHGIAFLISPSTDFSGATGAQYLGLFNTSSNGDPANRVAAVELDMIQNADLGDINDNHVGIDVNSLSSVDSFPAGYHTAAAGSSTFANLSISSGDPMQMWVEYDGGKTQLNVTLSPMGMAKPAAPLLSSAVDLSNITGGKETMYVGFSASTGTFTTSHDQRAGDGEFNGKLGDFGLARLYDHRTGPETTRVVGTMGYIAPELTGTGRATTATDVFAFGAFLLEVACGRRPIETQLEAEEMILVEWVLDNWKKGDMMSSVDPRLQLQGGGGGGGYAAEEVGMVLVLGLLCSHPSPAVRPGMKLVTQILDGDAALPELTSPGDFIASFQQWQQFEAFDNFVMSYPSSVGSEKLLSGSDNSVFRET